MAKRDAPAPRPDLVDFLRAYFASAATGIELHQMADANTGEVGPLVRQFPKDADVEALAVEIVAVAQRDCDAIGESQRYGVIADGYGRLILPVRSRSRSTCASCGSAL